MSHRRSPVAEQLVDTVQESPIFGVQPGANAKLTNAAASAHAHEGKTVRAFGEPLGNAL